MLSFFRILLVIILVYYLLKFFFRIILAHSINNARKKAEFNRDDVREDVKKEGAVTIKDTRSPAEKKKKVDQKTGEYIPYDEVKK